MPKVFMAVHIYMRLREVYARCMFTNRPSLTLKLH